MSDQKNPLDELAAKVNGIKQGNNVSSSDQKPLQPIEKFAESLIDEKGYPDLTPEVRVELRKDILTRLDDFIAARSIAALSDENVLIFERLLQDGKPESQIQQFLMDHIPEYQNFITGVLLEFKGVYLGTIPVPPVVPESPSEAPAMPPPPPPAPVKH